jgi:hypothetical protein
MSGLGVQSDHPGIIRTLKQMGVRKKPVIPFLGRNNPLNIFLGKLRAKR